MKPAIPFLNILISIVYITLTATMLYLLKQAVKPLTKANKYENGVASKQGKQGIDFKRLMLLSWFKKYSLFGNYWQTDKKYVLKQFMFVSMYALACLKINKIVFWPIALSFVLLPSIYVLFEVVMKKLLNIKVQDSVKIKNKANQIQSQLQIQSANIDQVNVAQQHIIKKEEKLHSKEDRTGVQVLILASMAFISFVMFFQTVMALTNSVSNSGQLNISSVLIIFVMDQAVVRPFAGLLIITTIFVFQRFRIVDFQSNTFVQLLCEEELRDLLIRQEKLRIKRLIQKSESPSRKKTDQQSKVPKVLSLSSQKNTWLNLINVQPTLKQSIEIQQVGDMIYLTTAQKDLFKSEEHQNKSPIQTKRRNNKENDVSCLSAPKFSYNEDEGKGFDDIVILKHNPLGKYQSNTYGNINNGVSISSINFNKRKGNARKINKRNLHLTGTSPYLQYLPDMLKNVDKYKNAAKQKKVL